MAIEFKQKSAAQMAAELFKDRPAPATKTGKSKRPVVTPAARKEAPKPAVADLKKKIDAIEAKPAKKSGKRGPAKGAETEVLGIRLEKDIVTKIKSHKNWQQIMKTIIYHEFDQ